MSPAGQGLAFPPFAVGPVPAADPRCRPSYMSAPPETSQSMPETHSAAVEAGCAIAILAAGGSSRYAGVKQTARLGHRTLIEHALAIALRSAATTTPIAVVTGAHRARVETVLAPHVARHQNLSLHHNPDWAAGMSTSLRAGLDWLEGTGLDMGAVLFMLGDQPRVSPDLPAALQRRWRQGWTLAAPVHEGVLLGAPALFARRWWPCIRALRGDQGARGILEHHRPRVGTVEVDPDSLLDVDTPEDLAGFADRGL